MGEEWRRQGPQPTLGACGARGSSSVCLRARSRRLASSMTQEARVPHTKITESISLMQLLERVVHALFSSFLVLASVSSEATPERRCFKRYYD